jgi:hypothetical protein
MVSRIASVARWTVSLSRRMSSLEVRSVSLAWWKALLASRIASVVRRTVPLSRRIASLANRSASLARWKASLAKRITSVVRRTVSLNKRIDSLQWGNHYWLGRYPHWPGGQFKFVSRRIASLAIRRSSQAKRTALLARRTVSLSRRISSLEVRSASLARWIALLARGTVSITRKIASQDIGASLLLLTLVKRGSSCAAPLSLVVHVGRGSYEKVY